MNWRPSATLETLRQRAALLATARHFFAERGLLEVETPALVRYAVTDPHLQNIFVAPCTGEALFLHTSPEFHMKRLLAAGAPDLWQLGKVFRAGEAGTHHEPEFTLVEWYRHGFTLAQMADETCALLTTLAARAEQLGAPATSAPQPPLQTTYQALFRDTLNLDPLTASVEQLQNCARDALGDRLGVELIASGASEPTLWLDLLMSHVVRTRLADTAIAVVRGYPAAQAALAQLDPADPRIAERFEIFCRGIEVANGYRELTDAAEQRQRFLADRKFRARLGRPDVVPDPHLLAALDHGLPDCAGVAVGFDRVVMQVLGLRSLQEAISFPVLESVKPAIGLT